MTWTDRLKGWLEWMLAPIIAAAAPFGILIVTLRAVPEEGTIDRFQDMLPEFIQSNERVMEVFDRLRRYAITEEELKAGAEKVVHDLADPLIDSLIEPLMNIPVLKPEEAFDKAKVLLGLTFGKDIAVGAAGVAAEAASLGQLDTLTNFYNSINSKIGFGGPATMMLKAPTEMGLVRPLSYNLHAKFRNVIPSVGEAITMYNKGDLAAEHLTNVFAWSGYYPWYEDAVRLGATREPFVYDLLRMSEGEEFDTDWLWRKAVRRQYSHEDATKLVKGQVAKYFLTYRRAIGGAYGRLHKEGFRSDDELYSTYIGFGFSESVSNLMLERGKLDYEYDRKMDLLAAYKDGFRKDLLTEADFRTCLGGIGMIDERIADTVFRETMRKTPKVKVKVIVERQGISLKSKPSGAHVYMDGVDLMLLTPEKIDTSPGDHTLDLYYPGYLVWTETFSVPSDRFIEALAELKEFEEFIE